jgi:cysteinyl-tRNA synthetase
VNVFFTGNAGFDGHFLNGLPPDTGHFREFSQIPIRMFIRQPSQLRFVYFPDWNFETGAAGENLLFYTAMHELAHHIMFTERKEKSVRAHTEAFYATLDDLVDVAEDRGLYRLAIDKETSELVAKAQELSREIAALQRELGQVIIQIEKNCKEKNLRAEDVIQRKAQISRKTAKTAAAAYSLKLPEEIRADIQEAAVKQRDEEKRRVIIGAGWKARAQSRQSGPPPFPTPGR